MSNDSKDDLITDMGLKTKDLSYRTKWIIQILAKLYSFVKLKPAHFALISCYKISFRKKTSNLEF